MKKELSEKNKYWIGKHRTYELMHFCRQYQSWKKALGDISVLAYRPTFERSMKAEVGEHSDPTAQVAIARKFYTDRIKLVEDTAYEVDPVIGEYILKGVTTGKSYDAICMFEQIPCNRRDYHRMLRYFYYLLSLKRK